MTIKLKEQNWVTDDGSYGYGEIITFENKDLTPRQNDVYDNLDESERFSYILAIMNGDPTDKWENDDDEWCDTCGSELTHPCGCEAND